MNWKGLLTGGLVVVLLFVLASFNQVFSQGSGLVHEPCDYNQWPDSGCTPGEYCASDNMCVLPQSGLTEFRSFYRSKKMEAHIRGTADQAPNMSKFSGGSTDGDLGYFETIEAELVCGMGGGCEPNESFAGGSGGAIGSVAGLINAVYSNPPANTYAFVVDTAKSMNIATPAYAQGVGFSALEPILEAWKISRNVAYFFFVVIFLAIGFLIMFRRKVGGQTAVTVQQAIPNIIIALIMVTFSYAIAGLLIDIMYLFMFAMEGLFKPDGVTTTLMGLSPFSLAFHFISSGAVTEGASSIGTAISDAIGDNLIGPVVGIVANLSALVIILIILVFNMFKLFIALLKVYVRLILNIAFAPLILMMGAIPGKNTFMPWIKSIFGNLAVFPAILMIILLFENLKQSSGMGAGFAPPFLATGLSSTLPVIAGIALVVSLPKMVEEVQKALGGAQQSMFGGLIEGGLGDMWKKRNVGLGTLAAPIAGAVGYKMAGNYGKRLGLKGRGMTAAKAAGLGAGASLGYKGWPILKSITTGAVGQARDALIGMKTDEFRTDLDRATERQKQEAQRNILNKQLDSQKTAKPTGKGPSKKRIDAMNKS